MTWKLVDNDSHEVREFSSKAKLKKWAKERGMEIKRCTMSERCYYTIPVAWVPGRQGET